MNCESESCSNIGEMKCLICSGSKVFCGEHGLQHKRVLNHKTCFIDDCEQIGNNLKTKVKQCIVKIAEDANQIISEIRKSSKEAIMNLKALNQNTKNLFEFNELKFNPKRVEFMKKEAKMMIHESKKPINDDLDDIYQELDKKKKEIESLNRKNYNSSKSIGKIPKACKNCTIYSVFNAMKIKEKKEHIVKKWKFVNIESWTEQILLSNDANYLFNCNIYQGKFKQTVYFKKTVSKIKAVTLISPL